MPRPLKSHYCRLKNNLLKNSASRFPKTRSKIRENSVHGKCERNWLDCLAYSLYSSKREEWVDSSNPQNTQKRLAGIVLPLCFYYDFVKRGCIFVRRKKTVCASTNKLLQKAENDSLLHNGSAAPKKYKRSLCNRTCAWLCSGVSWYHFRFFFELQRNNRFSPCFFFHWKSLQRCVPTSTAKIFHAA